MRERPEFYTEVMARGPELELRLRSSSNTPMVKGPAGGYRPWRWLAWRLGDLMLALGHRLTADRCCAPQRVNESGRA